MNRLAEQAAELRQALGHLQVEDRSGGFGDLLLHLAVALPKPEAITAGPNGERSARYRLERLVRLAVPELYSQTASQKTDPRFGDLIWDMASELIGDRLNAALEIIELLAGRVHEFYAARVREVPKEGSPALSRKELFARLAGHGLKAEEAAGVNRPSLPKGPAMDGFRALLKLIGDEATRALPESLPDGAEPNRDRAELLIELVDLAAAAGKGKAGDGLARCINDGARAYEMAPKLITEDFAPDIKPTSLEDLFG